ncbi:gamma-tubulin complex, DGRIP91/SPC98 component [Fistulina hepatica ATCC 64428]|nr:gamma-tubulin complex, DGRIP91/SPC98 component [Fistulina hepatica ATCC 64428]
MSSTTAITSLVNSIVSTSRTDQVLEKELVAHCQDVLSRYNYEPDLGHLADLIKRQLLTSTPSGATSLSFTNLLSRLLDQSALSRKHACVQFIHALSSSKPTSSTSTPPFLPSLVPPPPVHPRPNATPTESTSSRPIPKGKTKAEILKEYRHSMGKPLIPEAYLLRDTLYLLQGISGKYVRFSSPEEQHKLIFVDDATYTVPPPTKNLVHRLSEVGYLYVRVDNFVRAREGSSRGMIEQRLCHHLQTQLTEYYKLVAILETQMSASGDDARAEETGLTLRRLDVWINEWRLRMRMMSVCVEGAREAQGGALVNLIHGYTNNGDPFVRQFTDRLLEDVSKPFFAILHKWIFSGELYDPFGEFFVALDNPAINQPNGQVPHVTSSPFGAFGQDDADGSTDRENGLRLWENKYVFRKDMLPAFVGEAFGHKIFSTGRSLNFIRYNCHDSDWVATREKLSNTGGTLQYSDIPGLERSIDTAYQIASHRLFEVFLDKFNLLDHLRALKQYLLLGHGDFADQLMEALGPSLGRPANTLFRHNLTATLETAIRSTNAQNDSADVLRRLDARMLEYSHGEMGWDVFTLEYKVDPPIDTVIDPDSLMQYLKLFRHLWRMKRIERALGDGWMRICCGVRTFLRLPELEPEWHQIRVAMAEMIHFIRQIQAYCHLEVIECSWTVLHDFLIKKDGDLDELIKAHQTYLDRVVKKVLLLSPKTGKEETVLSHVREAFSDILQFREATDNFYNYCLSESARRDHEKDLERGVISEAAHTPFEDALPGLIGRVKEYSSAFSERAQTIVQQLQSHPDLDCRFLGVRLSFSEFYRSRKEMQQLRKEEQLQAQTPLSHR